MVDVIARRSDPVVAGARYRIAVKGRARTVTDGKHPALLTLRFRDATGRLLTQAPQGFATSDLLGPFCYLGKPGKAGELDTQIDMTAPQEAVQADVTLVRWHAESLTLTKPLRFYLAPLPGLTPAQSTALSDRLLGVEACSVAPGDSYLIRVGLASNSGSDTASDAALPDRAALAAVQFLDTGGTALPPAPGLMVSDTLGPFRYLLPDPAVPAGPHPQAQTRQVLVTAPPGAAQMTAHILRWEGGSDLRLTDCALVAMGAPDVGLASGHVALDAPTALCLGATLDTTRRQAAAVARLHVLYHAEDGTPLAPFGATHLLQDAPGPGSVWSPVCRVGAHLVPPAGAAALSWWLEPMGDAATHVALKAPVTLTPQSRDADRLVRALPDGAQLSLLPFEESAAILREKLAPDTAPWSSIGTGQISLIGAWAAPCAAEEAPWIMARAQVDAALDPATRPTTQVLLVPSYFDADGTLLDTGPHMVGCSKTDQAGLCRPAILRLKADGGIALSEAFLPPPDARQVLIHAFCWPPLGPEEGANERPGLDTDLDTDLDTGAAPPRALLSDLALHSAGSDAVGADLDPSLDPSVMSHLQLRCALQVARAAQDVPVEAALHRALSAYETKPAGHTAAARRMGAELALLDPDFLPDLPASGQPGQAGPAAPPAQGPVLYLTPYTGPTAWREGAHRTTTLESTATICARLTNQDTHGAPASLASAPGDSSGAAPDPLSGRDGMYRTGQIVTPRYAAWDPATLAPTDLACIEARLFAHIAHETGAGLVHVVGDVQGPGLALAGLALAQSRGLGFVYERLGLEASALGPQVTQALHRQEARLMQAAHRVVVPSPALRDALTAQGVAADKITIVAPGIDPVFLTPTEGSVPSAVPDLKLGLGLPPEAQVLGWTPDPANPEAETLLLEALAALVAQDVDLHLVCLETTLPDARAQARARTRAQAMTQILPGRVTVTGPQEPAARRDWLRACDAVLDLCPNDPRYAYLPPRMALEALALGVPLIATDSAWQTGAWQTGLEGAVSHLDCASSDALASGVMAALTAHPARIARTWPSLADSQRALAAVHALAMGKEG